MQGQAKLPDGAAILDRYVEVTGGKAAYQKIKSECDKTVVGPEDGPHFSVTACTARGGKKRMITETAGGRAEEGVNDQIVWELSSVTGVRIKEGAEKRRSLARARGATDADWRETFSNAENTGEEEIHGKRCYKVVLTISDGGQEIRYYDKETGLLARAIQNEIRDTGEVSAQVDIDEYRDYQGVKMPSSMRVKFGAQELPPFKIVSVAFNSEVPAKTFDLPREVELAIKQARGGTRLPNGAALFEKYVAATGGIKGYGAIETQQISADFTLRSAGIEAKMMLYIGKGGKQYQSIELPGMGKMEMGSDGTTSWERSVTLGPRIVPKSEAKQGLLGPDPDMALNWTSAFSKVETIGEDEADNRPCFSVRLTPKEGGAAATACFDKVSGYITKLTTVAHNQMGDIPFTLVMRDYRDEGPVKMPHQIETSVVGQDVVVNFKEVKINGEIPAKTFELPDDVHALLDKQAAEGKEKKQ